MNGIDGMNRRDLLKLAGASAAVMGVGGVRPYTGRAQDGSYAGITIRGLGLAGMAWNAAATAFGAEFEAKTGAKVEWDFQPWEQTLPKIQADLAAGTPTYDFYCNDIEFSYTVYPSLLPINDLIASRGYSMEGFFEPVLKYGEGVSGGEAGVRYVLPMRVGASWVFYRTDLISEFPTTWDDYHAMLAAQTTGGKFGLAFAGVPAQLVKLFLARFWSKGGALLDADWNPTINTEIGVAALQSLIDASKQFAPPGILAWDNPEAANVFLNGDVAVLEGWSSSVLPFLEDPAASKVAGKWSVAKYPENGTGNFTQHNFGIFNTSKNAEATFDYVAYCTGIDNAARVLNEFKEESPRKSVWTDPAVATAQPYLATVAEAYDVGRPFTPGLPQWLELFIGLAEGLSSALSDQRSAQDALNDTAKKWETSIKQAPPDWQYSE